MRAGVPCRHRVGGGLLIYHRVYHRSLPVAAAIGAEHELSNAKGGGAQHKHAPRFPGEAVDRPVDRLARDAGRVLN